MNTLFRTLVLTTVSALVTASTHAAPLKKSIYCYEAMPTATDEKSYYAQILTEDGRAANWIVVSSVDTKEPNKETELVRKLVDYEAGTIEEGFVTHRMNPDDHSLLEIEYPHRKITNENNSAILALKLDGQYIKLPMRCRHMN